MTLAKEYPHLRDWPCNISHSFLWAGLILEMTFTSPMMWTQEYVTIIVVDMAQAKMQHHLAARSSDMPQHSLREEHMQESHIPSRLT